jgi:hypothetical protein
MAKALLIPVSGHLEVIDVNDYKDFNAAVDCDCGTLVGVKNNNPEEDNHDTVSMWMDDEGLLTGKAPNFYAAIVSEIFPHLVGNAVLFRTDDMGETVDVTVNDIGMVLSRINDANGPEDPNDLYM